jgi:phosphoglycerol transferase MdoB-like AlkP superfamily enzyme
MPFSYLLLFCKRIGLLLGLYTASRLLFYYYYPSSFSLEVFYSFLEGIRFDLSALLYINAPFFLLLIASYWSNSTLMKRFSNIVFYVVNIPFLLANNADAIYFQFTQKRSTADIFQLLSLGDDASTLLPQYAILYWPISLFILAQIILLTKMKRFPKGKQQTSFTELALSFLLLAAFFVLGARGGTQLKPIKPIHAGLWSNPTHSSLVLNTPFCLLHSFNEEKLPEFSYFEEAQLNDLYTPIHSAQDSLAFQKENVVLIILESFSKEFIGYYNDGLGHTPFLDSLMRTGLAYTQAYANGIKSIEALPAITAGIPTLMDNPFITSSAAANKFESLASLLNKEGYHSSFFHGGSRGTMGFYEFSLKAGFEHYYGREEYNNEADYDGTWGIYDAPFMGYFAHQLNSFEEPFFSTFFSLSSHLPYVVPQKLQEQFPKGELEIHHTIAYTDFALKQFFNKIKGEDWFKKTLFIFTADHTSPLSNNKQYKNRVGRYAIPLLFWKADGSLTGIDSSICQQTDIMATSLDYLHYPHDFFSFGKSLTAEDWAISYRNNHYLFISKDGFLLNREEDYSCYEDLALKNKVACNPATIQLLKAIKQQYNSRLNNNQIITNDHTFHH